MCTCLAPTAIEWTESNNGEPCFVRGRQHAQACADHRTRWTFDARGSFDTAYWPVSATDDRVRTAELHAAFGAEPWGPLCRTVLEAVAELPDWITGVVERNSAGAFEPVQIIARAKEVRTIDLMAECLLISRLRERLSHYDPVVLGEESLRDPTRDFSAIDRAVILVDAVDGTRQLERNRTGQWCSAAVVFHPPTREILASVVALPNGWTYFTIGRRAAKCRCRAGRFEFAELTGPSAETRLPHCAVAFYGQKKDYLRANGALAERINPFLIWPGGGNPAIVQLVDGRAVDAVYEVRGQWPHDVVPGLAVAQAAGATLLSLDGTPIDLIVPLCRPGASDSRLCYVAASTPGLAQAIVAEAAVGSSVIAAAGSRVARLSVA